jgi:hypothetical protein
MKKIFLGLSLLSAMVLTACVVVPSSSTETESSSSDTTTSEPEVSSSQPSSTSIEDSNSSPDSSSSSSTSDSSSSSSQTSSSSEETSSSENSSSSEDQSSSSENNSSSESEPELLFAPDLFISEYIEGTSNNKAFEIANFTGQDVDLSQYLVWIYSNGAATSTKSQVLSGTLKHGEVFVIAGALTSDPGMVAALAEIPAERKLVTTFEQGSIAAAYNGDDAFALFKGETMVDVFGTIGFDPGTGWDAYTYGQVASGVTPTTIDRTLTRLPGFGPKVGLIETYVAFDPLEWRVDATHYQTLGSHIYFITS